jgi:hypothetical protein
VNTRSTFGTVAMAGVLAISGCASSGPQGSSSQGTSKSSPTVAAGESPGSSHVGALYVMRDRKALKKNAEVIAVVHVTAISAFTYTASPLKVDPTSTEYPYAPGFTPTEFSKVPGVLLTSRVVKVLKGKTQVGETMSIKYIPASDGNVAEKLTPAGVGYLVYLTNLAGGPGWFAETGPYSIFKASDASDTSFSPILSDGLVTGAFTLSDVSAD